MPKDYIANNDEKKLTRMTYKILEAESENLRTRERTNEAMIDLIKKIIKRESSRNY